jgi:hypothetical protein
MSHVKQGQNLGGEWIRKVVILCEVVDDSVHWTSYHEDYRFWWILFKKRTSLFWATLWALTEVVIFLIDEQGIKITEEEIWAAASSKGGGVPVLKFLLDRTDIKITLPLVEAVAVAWNRENGKGLMQVLLDQRGAEIKITEEVV